MNHVVPRIVSLGPSGLILTCAVILGMAALPAPARADLYLVDQVNDNFRPMLFQNINSFAPFGQEFTPALPFLDVVELYVDSVGTGGGSLFVNIRSGTITGPILGTSDSVFLPIGFRDVTRLDFPSIIALNLGELYVMELVQAQGLNLLAGSSGGSASTYPFGRIISRGIPLENNDLWFREGSTVPEPATLALWAVGALGLLGYARRLRKQPAA